MKKVQCQLTNVIEFFNTNRAVLYGNCIFKLSKISGKYCRDIRDREVEKCRKVCVVFTGTNCINEMLDYVSVFKGETKTVNNKIVKYNLHIKIHNGNGFDSYVVLNNLPQRRTVVK